VQRGFAHNLTIAAPEGQGQLQAGCMGFRLEAEQCGLTCTMRAKQQALTTCEPVNATVLPGNNWTLLPSNVCVSSKLQQYTESVGNALVKTGADCSPPTAPKSHLPAHISHLFAKDEGLQLSRGFTAE
jgi:hypothetical protein